MGTVGLSGARGYMFYAEVTPEQKVGMRDEMIGIEVSWRRAGIGGRANRDSSHQRG